VRGRNDRRLANSLVGRGGEEYLFRDTFGAGSVTSPRTATPGPGTLTLVGSKWSLSGGKLAWTANSGSLTTEIATSAAITREAGRVLLGKLTRTGTNGIVTWGFWPHGTSAADNNQDVAFQTTATPTFRIRETKDATTVSSVELDPLTADTEYDVAIVLRTTGAFWFIKGGAYTSWTLLWVGNGGNGNGATVVPALNNHSQAGTLDNQRIARRLWLPASHLETTDAAGIAAALKQIGSGKADVIADMSVTRGAGAGGTTNGIKLALRATDASFGGLANNWGLIVFDNGSVVLRKTESSADTDTTLFNSGTIGTSTTRVVRAVLAGSTMRFYIQHVSLPQSWTASSVNPFTTGTTFNQTATYVHTIPLNSQSNMYANSVTVWKRDWSEGFPNV
jgi:hypothetical protein